ncbi:MAG: HpcH/HpaI aldolase family protein [Chloroflexota bacterium]
MRKNHFRELLKAGKPTLGTHAHSSWPTIFELIGHTAAFDYVEFSAEYAPFDLYTLENLGRAIELFPNFTGMIKVDQEPRTHLAVRALCSGFQSVLFADVRSVAEAEECVAAVRAETPGSGGRHGVALSREVGVVLEAGSPAFVQAMDDAVVAIMIEKKEAVENIEAILSVKGIDMVQFGPSDYSMSMGLVGQRGHPAIREAEEHMIAVALRKGIAPRVEVHTPQSAERYMKLGVKHFCIGWDVRILFNWWKENGQALRALLGDAG